MKLVLIKSLKYFLRLLVISILICVQSDAFAQQGMPTFYTYQPHAKGDTLFALNAKTDIYKSADSTSKIIAGCNAGDTLFIFEAGVVNNENYQLPEYYKVKYRSKTGYVKATDLALARFENEINQTTLLMSVESKDNQVYFSFKTYYLNQLTFEMLDSFYVKAFEITLTGNRGLDGIDKIIQIDHYAEACGEGGGIIYYNWTEGEIKYLAHLSDMSDGGDWHSESFVFPQDSGGVEGKVFFAAQSYELRDEEHNWEINTKETRTYNWVDGGFDPPFIRSEDEE
nr:hypothetical protein [Bacteroidota bacterium]